MPKPDPHLDELRKALDESADRLATTIKNALGNNYDPAASGVYIDPRHTLSVLRTLAEGWMKVRMAQVEHKHAFTNFMMAIDARRQEHQRGLEAAAEQRAKRSEKRERNATIRGRKADHRAHEANMRERRAERREWWIAGAVLVSALGTVIGAANSCHGPAPIVVAPPAAFPSPSQPPPPPSSALTAAPSAGPAACVVSPEYYLEHPEDDALP